MHSVLVLLYPSLYHLYENFVVFDPTGRGALRRAEVMSPYVCVSTYFFGFMKRKFKVSDVKCFSFFQISFMRGVSCCRREAGAISVVQHAEEVRGELGKEAVVSSASVITFFSCHNWFAISRCGGRIRSPGTRSLQEEELG